MEQKFTISVIIPTFNRATYTRQAIESVLAQSRVPDEIIVIDDGSTELDIEAFTRYGPPVMVIQQSRRGRSAARNTGLRLARGELIVLLDSDDLLPADSIHLRAECLEIHPDIDVVYGQVTVIDSNGDERGTFREHSPSGFVFPNLACNNLAPPSAFMFRRACLESTGYFDEQMDLLEDFDFFVRMAANHIFCALDFPVACYRLHSGNTITFVDDTVVKAAIEIQQRVFEMSAFRTLTGTQKAIIYCSHGTKNARIGNTRLATRHYLQAIARDAFYMRSYILLVMTLLLGSWRFRLSDPFLAQLNRWHMRWSHSRRSV